MVFSSMTFLFGFLPIVLLIYYAVPKRVKNLIIMISGLFFYAWGEPVYVLVMLLTIAIDYSAGLLMERLGDRQKKRLAVMIAAVVLNLLFLGIFKYSSFVVQNINALFHTSIPDPKLPLPIGISFYTFQAMSYVIDLYRREIRVQKSFVNFAGYVTLFPQLIAGPIVRYSDIEAQIDGREISIGKIGDGVSVFIRGLAKKVILANTIGAVWTSIKAMDYTALPAATAWIGILAFTFQIYYDFSGYSDMAIGLGKMLGFDFPPNFHHPYLSKSITEFWRRWHMTLGSWFRSYVYIPMGGNRVGKWGLVRNILVVWMLTGLWHGASWNFVFWGLYFGVILLIEKLFLGKLIRKLPNILQWLYAFLLIVFGWVLFEMNSLPAIGNFVAAMFGLNGAGFADRQSLYLVLSNIAVILLCAVCATTLPRRVFSWLRSKWRAGANGVRLSAELLLFFVCLCYHVTSTYNPFLYFNF